MLLEGGELVVGAEAVVSVGVEPGAGAEAVVLLEGGELAILLEGGV